MRKMRKRYPDAHFDFHAHNDYDLAVSNVLAAVLSGAQGLHTTINGLGEPSWKCTTGQRSGYIERSFQCHHQCGREPPERCEPGGGVLFGYYHPCQSAVGRRKCVYTQSPVYMLMAIIKVIFTVTICFRSVSGVCANMLWAKLRAKPISGKISNHWDYSSTKSRCRKVTERIIELGDKKELVTQEDLPYIISDVLKHDGVNNKVKLKSYFVTLANGLKPMATLQY